MLESLNYWHWLGFGLLLLIAELIGAAGFLLWTGISAGLIGLITLVFPALTWRWQLFLFAVLTIVVLVLWWRHLQNRIDTSDLPNLNDRAAQFIGRIGELVEPIKHGRGVIELDDSRWKVTGPDLKKGQMVRVTRAVDDLLLEVEKVD